MEYKNLNVRSHLIQNHPVVYLCSTGFTLCFHTALVLLHRKQLTCTPFPGRLAQAWLTCLQWALFVAESSRVTYWLGLSGCRSTIINHNVSKAYGCWLLLRSGFGLNALFCKISEKVGYNEKKIIDFQYGYFHKNYDVMIKWLCKGTRVHFPSPLFPNAIYITYLFYKTHKS